MNKEDYTFSKRLDRAIYTFNTDYGEIFPECKGEGFLTKLRRAINSFLDTPRI